MKLSTIVLATAFVIPATVVLAQTGAPQTGMGSSPPAGAMSGPATTGSPNYGTTTGTGSGPVTTQPPVGNSMNPSGNTLAPSASPSGSTLTPTGSGSGLAK